MFREMRRKRQLLSPEECWEILERNSCGVLAVAGDDDYPYAVPLNYCVMDGKLWFHGARSGHRLDAVAKQSKVSFCVVDYEKNVPEEFTVYFRSVIVFGRAAVVTDETEALRAITCLAEKYSPNESGERKNHAIEAEKARMTITCLTPEHITGKQAIELVPGRGGR